MEMETAVQPQEQTLQMQQQPLSPYRQPQQRASESSPTTTAPFAYTSKFRIIECSAGRNWTDADILTLIESYKECKRHEIEAREATTASVYAANTRTRSADGPNPVASSAVLMTAALEKPETADAFFEKVHSVFVKGAMNPQRTAKSLHEKFGFLTVTYRRIKDFQTGKLFGAPAGVSWWDIPVKEQRRYLSKSMTPISDIVYEALEPLIERSDFQKRVYSVLQSRIQPVPTTTTTFTMSDAPLMNTFRVSVAPALTQRSPVHSQPESPTTITRIQSNPVVATPISDSASITSSATAQATSQSAIISSIASRQDMEKQQDVYVQLQYRHRQSGSGTSPHTQTNPNSSSAAMQRADSTHMHSPANFTTQQHRQHQSFQIPLQLQTGNNVQGNYYPQMPNLFDPASAPSPRNPPPNQQRPQNRGASVASTIQRQATRNADVISGDLDPAAAVAMKRRRIDQGASTVAVDDECDYEEYAGEEDDAGIAGTQPSTTDYPPPLEPPPGASTSQREPQQSQRMRPSAEGILHEFVTLYKRSLEEQRQRDEQLLATLQGISQMTSAICKAVEQGHVHSNSNES
ncbi:uncharacterized protein V1513DRAFT_485218 [Lipomyces chichibuensis]|uniref:uncharacterized protein n=1 Tax=Lipomyces chichibuensis TaxID=1546026 RepID=UPI003343D271